METRTIIQAVVWTSAAVLTITEKGREIGKGVVGLLLIGGIGGGVGIGVGWLLACLQGRDLSLPCEQAIFVSSAVTTLVTFTIVAFCSQPRKGKHVALYTHPVQDDPS